MEMHFTRRGQYSPRSRAKGKPAIMAIDPICGMQVDERTALSAERDGKAAENHQRVSILFARSGIAALSYDPIGQGERYQAFAPDGQPLTGGGQVTRPRSQQLENLPGKPTFGPVEEHTLMGIGSILVGRNTATYRIFDGMRCIDYLVSRPDIDADKIGCTGVSGGGTLTSYLMALDERIKCAASVCLGQVGLGGDVFDELCFVH